MAKLRIGIEACGKSYTFIAVADEIGQILYAQKFDLRLNYHEQVRNNLGVQVYHLVKEALSYCGITVNKFCSDEGNICAGITGVTTKFDRQIGFETIWKAAGLTNAAKRIATGGIEIAFTGATGSLRGAALSCHTGSAALARTESAIKRVGGWGSSIGDEGSGYWIGTQAINHLFRLRDNRSIGIKTKLPDYIRAELENFSQWNEVSEQYKQLSNNNWIDGILLLAERTKDSKEYRYIVSDLAIGVLKLYQENPEDYLAQQILIQAAKELSEQATRAIFRVGLENEEIPIVLWGGVFRNNLFFCNLVMDFISQQLPLVKKVLPTDEDVARPVIGSLLFALSGSIKALPAPDVVERIMRESTDTEFGGALLNY